MYGLQVDVLCFAWSFVKLSLCTAILLESCEVAAAAFGMYR
jgi:hypothetical protein